MSFGHYSTREKIYQVCIKLFSLLFMHYELPILTNPITELLQKFQAILSSGSILETTLT